MKSYVIHHESSVERNDIIEALKQKTGAIVVDAVWLDDRVRGCLFSHVKVAERAKQDAPGKPYLVFEDDCELLKDIDEILSNLQEADITYLGYNDQSEDKQILYGTHAMVISPPVRELILEVAPQVNQPYDHFLSFLANYFKMRIAKPSYEEREASVRQKKGLISTITGGKRE